MEPEEEDATTPDLASALQALPLLADDLYLKMQAANLAAVDALLESMETQLLHEYIELDRTPIPTFNMVSALSQLWVFGVYELLRTWRQRARQVLRFADDVRSLAPEERAARIASQKEKVRSASADPDHAHPRHYRAFEQAATDEGYANGIRATLDRSERPFRRIEALRVHLAKHEMPKTKWSFGMAPGYGRIDSTTGSIWWQVPLRGMEVDSLTRREVASECRKLGSDQPLPLLPEAIRDKLARVPEHSYGIKRVILLLDDGSAHESYVAWNKEVVFVPGHTDVPFDAGRVVEVRYESSEPEGAA